MKKTFFFMLLAAAGVACLTAVSEAQNNFAKPGSQAEVFTTARIIPVRIETSLGVIEAELYPQEAPRTVQNFTDLARKGFYDGLTFHRVVPGVIIQTGDPEGNGRGGPGYKFKDEFSPNLKHDGPGILSMANAGPNTNGSQFFITQKALPKLDGHHSVFGRVTSGIEVADAISRVPRNGKEKPLDTVWMKKVTVLEGVS
ncbi:MAG TPA: peptidylprolyl isomerase [Candidatus Omnitrophota bacterium]|nr:peptidylprolyl isomerase [Candidatus Omnitrophota bacterium]